MAEDFCRLCLRPVDKANCAEIKKDEAKQEMFSEFFPELNIDLSANPTLCNECALNLEVSSNFKQGVLENEARIESELAKSKSKAKKKKIDLKTLLDAETKNELKSDLSICRTCLAICKDPSIRLYEAKTNVMPYSFVKKMCVQIFELEFTNSDKPVMCDECWETLQNAYDFRKNCLKTEKKITSYCQENKLTVLGEIDLKKLNSLPANEDDSEMSDDDDFGDVDIKEEIFDPNDPDLSNPGSSSSSLQHVKLKKEEDGASGSVSVKSESGMDDEDEDMGDHPDLVDPNNLKSEEDGEGDDIDTKMEVGDTVKVDPEAAGAAGPSGKKSTTYSDHHQSELGKLLCNIPNIATEDSKHRIHSLHQADDINQFFSCDHCSFTTKRKRNLLRHEITMHSSDDRVQMFSCKHCSFYTKHKGNLKNHIITHQLGDTVLIFSCTICPFTTKQKAYLKRHQIVHQPKDTVQMFSCTICPFATKHKAYLKRHLKTHQPSDEMSAQMFSCAHCSFTTKHRKSLGPHLKTHQPKDTVQMLSCTVCSYVTRRKACLKRHLNTHQPGDPVQMFSCADCSCNSKQRKCLKCFMITDQSNYKAHLFCCTQCAFETYHQPTLKRHFMLTHQVNNTI